MLTRKFSLYFLLLLLVVAVSSPAKTLKVSVSGGTEKINYYENDEVIYYSFSQFIELIGGGAGLGDCWA